VDQVAELVRENAQALVRGPHVLVGRALFSLVSELRDGIGDRTVEAPVERAELRRGDGLAEIAVVEDDLAHGESPSEAYGND